MAALALDYSPVAQNYTDAPFTQPVTAAVNVLTHLQAVQGYPDGSFRPMADVNRAEFLKIAFLSHPTQKPTGSDAASCFPDVQSSDWFAPSVCRAKEFGVVQGYPDGFFHPERTVQHVEALKMLAELYDATLPSPPANERWTWYRPYIVFAEESGTALPETLAPDALLSRGEVARLIAAFRAYHDGELEDYRRHEQGDGDSSASSASSRSSLPATSASSVHTSAQSSMLSSSASSASSQLPQMPSAMSHLLLAGTRTPLIAEGSLAASDEDRTVRLAEVELRDDVEGIESLHVVDGAGRTLVELHRSGTITDEQKRTWEGDVGDAAWHVLPSGSAARIGIRAQMKQAGSSGTSGEVVEVVKWTVGTRGQTTGKVSIDSPTSLVLPRHQTAIAAVTGLRNTLASSMTVTEGSQKLLASYALSATGGSVTLQEFTFAVEMSNVQMTRPRIGGQSTVLQQDCGMYNSNGVLFVSCTVFPEWMRSFRETLEFSLVADVSLTDSSSPGTLRIRPVDRGSIGQNGAIRFGDGTTIFSWIESNRPLEAGPNVTITP